MDTSSAEQDEVDIGRDEADEVGGTEPRPRGFPPLTTARQQDRDGDSDGIGYEQRKIAEWMKQDTEKPGGRPSGFDMYRDKPLLVHDNAVQVNQRELDSVIVSGKDTGHVH